MLPNLATQTFIRRSAELRRSIICNHATIKSTQVVTSSISKPGSSIVLFSTTSPASSIPSSIQGSPTSVLVEPGRCQFGPDFVRAALVEKFPLSDSSAVFRFALPDKSLPLNLSTCACILARTPMVADEEDIDNAAPPTTPVVRPYTPISTNAQVGTFDLLVKRYENGNLSKYLHDEVQPIQNVSSLVAEADSVTIPVSSALEFAHIPPNVKIQAPFSAKHIVMLAGGTGITPMIQALHAILDDKTEPKATVQLIYGSQHADDILAKDLLTAWSEKYPDQLQVHHVLSNEPSESSWDGFRGHMTKDILESLGLPSLSSNPDGALVMVCGPPPMYQALCGPRDEPTVTGALAEMSFADDQVYKF